MTTMKLLPAKEFIADATKQIQSAKNRVAVLAMVVADNPATHDFFEALFDAARRGVDVHVAADIFTYGEVSGSFLPIRYYSKKGRTTTNMGKKLRDAGVKFHWLGRSHMTIVSGRTHSKWCVVDNITYTFGGVNLYQEGIEKNVDYMFKVSSAKLSQSLFGEHLRLERADRSGRLRKSHQFDLDNNHVLIDGGILGNSIIYRRACDLASSAESIVYVSQYPPTSRLSRLILEKPHTLYFNKPRNAALINRIVIRLSMFRSNVKTSYRRRRYLHAKCLIFYMPDGSRVAITGSHNFNFTTVMLGTREIALETRDGATIDQLESFIQKEVAP
jgi:cardiolipin synthase